LEREPDLVLRDVIDGKVSVAAARDDYGVILRQSGDDGSSIIDEQATKDLREKRAAKRRGDRAIIDRGDGFEKMLNGEFKPWQRSA
jgi:N-methylhydantoinase B